MGDAAFVTLPETNIAPENGPSQKETSIPTIHFQVLKCQFLGVYCSYVVKHTWNQGQDQLTGMWLGCLHLSPSEHGNSTAGVEAD